MIRAIPGPCISELGSCGDVPAAVKNAHQKLKDAGYDMARAEIRKQLDAFLQTFGK